jgi:hypothetical protein
MTCFFAVVRWCCQGMGGLVLAGLVWAWPAWGQDQPRAEAASLSEVKVEARWTAGERQRFRFEKTRQRRGQEPFLERYEVEVEVLSSTDDGGYRLLLRQPAVHLPDRFLPPSKDIAPYFQQAANRLGELTLVVRVGASGEVVALENWQDLRDRVMDVMRLAGAGSPPASLQSQLQQVREWYRSEAAARESLMTEVGHFLAPLGHELVPGEPLELEQAVPIATLGIDIRSVNRYLLLSDQPASGLLTVKTEQGFDHASVQKALMNFFDKQPAADKEAMAQRVRQELGMSLTDVATYVVDRRTGWLQQAEYVRELGLPVQGGTADFRQVYRVTRD